MEDNRSITKFEIEEAIHGKGDFVKIDYLRRYLAKADNVELKKFILISLSGIYEAKNMLKEAVQNLRSASDISVTYREKIELYKKEIELHIRLLEFDAAEKAFRTTHAFGNSSEKIIIQQNYVLSYYRQAKVAENAGKNRHAMQIYEKLFSLKAIPMDMKAEVKEKLLGFYEKFGRISDVNLLKGMEL